MRVFVLLISLSTAGGKFVFPEIVVLSLPVSSFFHFLSVPSSLLVSPGGNGPGPCEIGSHSKRCEM